MKSASSANWEIPLAQLTQLGPEELAQLDSYMEEHPAHCLERGVVKRVILKLKKSVLETDTIKLNLLLDRLVLIQNPKDEIIAAGDAPIDKKFIFELMSLEGEITILAPLELIEKIDQFRKKK